MTLVDLCLSPDASALAVACHGEDEDEGMLDEELVERVDAMKREVDALLALVIVLLVVVGALIVYLVPWRRRPAFASPSLSVELNPTTYNELGRSVEGI